MAIRFQTLFELVVDKEAMVDNYVELEGVGSLSFWNVRLRRQLKDEEMGVFLALLVELYGLKGVGTEEDEMRWLDSSSGKFSVKSFYQIIKGGREAVVPRKLIWFSGIPTKVSFFVWTTALNRILTIDNLVRRGWVLVNRCCMCGMAAESVDHLMLHCVVASQLWALIFALFGLLWAQPGTVSAALWSWSRGRVGRRRQKAWFFAPHCLMWLIWLERNRRTFQDVSMPVFRLKSTLLSWVSGRVEPDLSFFLDFIDGLAV